MPYIAISTGSPLDLSFVKSTTIGFVFISIILKLQSDSFNVFPLKSGILVISILGLGGLASSNYKFAFSFKSIIGYNVLDYFFKDRLLQFLLQNATQYSSM